MKKKNYLYPLYGFIGLIVLSGAIFVSLLAVEMGGIVYGADSSSEKESICYNLDEKQIEKKMTDFEVLATNAIASYEVENYKDVSFKDKIFHIFERGLGYILAFIIAFLVVFIIKKID
jgi:hypothetical protein